MSQTASQFGFFLSFCCDAIEVLFKPLQLTVTFSLFTRFSRFPDKLKFEKFGFMNGVDNVNWPPYRDSKS